MKKILIMSLSESSKSYLTQRLAPLINVAWDNAKNEKEF